MSDSIAHRLSGALADRYRSEGSWARAAWRLCTWPTTSTYQTRIYLAQLFTVEGMRY
jgi:hypothetical protein